MRGDGMLREVIQELEQQGWRLEKLGSGHVRCVPPDPTKQAIVTGGTSGDWRAVKNWISQLRRSGFVWDQHQAKKRRQTQQVDPQVVELVVEHVLERAGFIEPDMPVLNGLLVDAVAEVEAKQQADNQEELVRLEREIAELELKEAVMANTDEGEYQMEAVWVALKQARTGAARAQERKDELTRRAHEAGADLERLQRHRDEMKRALDAVLAGAKVEWNERSKRFVVKLPQGHTIEIPKPQGDDRPRVVPANAAHVGSSIQGKVGT